MDAATFENVLFDDLYPLKMAGMKIANNNIKFIVTFNS